MQGIPKREPVDYSVKFYQNFRPLWFSTIEKEKAKTALHRRSFHQLLYLERFCHQKLIIVV